MKKSFKKAGAAVLSMAMLLSMGAMSMPVYADQYGNATGTGKPATVTVKINGLSNNVYLQGEGSRDNPNGDGSDTAAQVADGSYSPKYDYWTFDGQTEGLENAKVTMYRIAKLTNDKGWQWEDFVTDYKGNTEDLVEFVDFEDLMKNKDTGGEFNTSAVTLQKMASWFERAIESLKADAANDSSSSHTDSQATLTDVTVATRTFGNAQALGSGVDLIVTDVEQLDVNHDGIVDEDEMAKTQNVIGYYLIVTETDQSGAIVQPVLLCLKNGEKKVVAVKGSSIEFEKTMTSIHSTDEDADKDDDRFLEDQKSGLVEQDDIVHFQIVSQIPKYDANVRSGNINSFVITDTASDGLYLDILDASGNIDPDKFEVYLASDKAESDEDGMWKLQGDKLQNVGDYKLTVDNSGSEHTFKLEISGYQMRETDARRNDTNNRGVAGADGKIDDIPLLTSAGQSPDAAPSAGAADSMTKATRLNSDYNKAGLDSMEGQYIVINYQAKVNRKTNGEAISSESELGFDRSFTDYIQLKDVKAGMVQAVGDDCGRTDGYTALADLKKQAARVQLMNGETRYNKTYTKDDYKAGAAKFAAITADADKTALATAVANALVTLGETPAPTAEAVKAAMFQAGTEADPETDAGNFYRIVALLALDKYNLTLNGENNTAYMTYGNRYATGKGVSQLNTDYSKVYSVDLELSKFIELDNLEGIPAIQANTTAYGAFVEPYIYDATNNPNPKTITVGDYTFTMAEYEAAVAASKASPSTATEAQTALLAAVNTYVGDTTAVTTAATAENGKGVNPVTGEAVKPEGDGTTVLDTTKAAKYTSLSGEAQKLVTKMVSDENTARTTAGNQYQTINDKKPVVGAIFHLVRTYDTDKTIDLGYAISTTNGDLQKLTLLENTDGTVYESDTKITAVPATGVKSVPAGSEVYYFQDENDGKWHIGYIAVTKTGDEITSFNGDTTWRMLDIGDYTIYELSVPTGYKKWDSATFTISAKQDETPDYLAEDAFTGEFEATANIEKNTAATSSHGFGSIAETKADNKVTFKYEKTTGTLSHEMYNEYLDQLPATGGMGTVLFTAGGIAVILMAGALFVVYMKKRNAEEEE